jgi:HlyD family secretion protein
MAGVLAGWGCSKGEAEAPPPANEFAIVERRNLDVKAEASGTIEPIRVVEVKSKASGEILRLPVETGDVVARGDLLATVDPRDVSNAYNQAKADLDVAEARVANSEAMLKRTDELRKANVATEQELEQAQLDIANQRAQLVKAQTNLQLAEERLKDVTIRAPIAGVVIERPVEVGTIIASASQNVSGGTTLMKMADLTQMQVRALIDETDLGKIRAGMSVQVSVEAYPDRKFQGTVLKIEPQAVIDQNVTMFPVLVELDNQAGLLKVGMNADVEIQISSRENVIVVPNSAVVTTRDAPTAGAVLGLTEDQVRTALQPVQPPANPEQAGPQQGSPAAAQAGAAPTSGGV